MLRILPVFLFFFLLIQIPAESQTISQKAVPEKWITSWLLCGPIPLSAQEEGPAKGWHHSPDFGTDFLKQLGGEANLQVKAGDMINFPGGNARWKHIDSPTPVIDLRAVLSREAPLLAYAYTEIVSEKDQMMLLAFGTNDGGSLFVNGELLWDHATQRSLHIDGDHIPVSLKKGTNKILFKIEQFGNKWEFCARLLPFDFSDLSGQDDIFRLDPTTEGTARLSSRYEEAVLRHLVNEVSVKIDNSLGQSVWSSQHTQNFTEARVSLPSRLFQSYLVHYDVVLKSGEKLHFHQRMEAGEKQDFVLFSGGNTNYTIALTPDASSSEKWAAEELRHWLKEISGADFPITSLKESKSPRIIVGFNPVVEKLTGMKRPAGLDEAYYYRNEGADILIYGGQQRGTMYGVMSFLENEFGVRWYTPTVTVVPKRDRFSFHLFGHTEKPGIRVRNDFYYEAFDPVWAARNKNNGSMSLPDQPGGVESYWSVHTFYPLVPPEEFFETHPEYYSLLSGKRVSQGAQLCLSNPDVLTIIKDRIRKQMREHPEYLIYDVSQNDYYNPCECDKCQAIAKREGGESGIMIWFVNQVAEAVEKEFPDKFIGTLAYQYTRSVPKEIKPRENVVVRFCSIECCFAHDFKTCPENKSFMDDLTGWSKRAPHLYIWDYVVNFSHYAMPYPNFAVLQPNIKTFQENKSIGIMEQAAYQSRGGELAELRAYVISKLLWNPDANTEEVIADFMYGYYGRAGKFIREYYDLLQGLVTPDTHIGLGTEPVDRIYTEKFIDESLLILGKARKVAENEDMLRRVDLVALPVLYLRCRRTPFKALHDGSYERFTEISEREGITHLSEAGKPDLDAFHHMMKNAK